MQIVSICMKGDSLFFWKNVKKKKKEKKKNTIILPFAEVE